jgi:hypothetical protein
MGMGKLYFGFPDGSSYESDANLLQNNISLENLDNYASNIHIPLSADAEASFECEINRPLFERFFGVDLSIPHNISFSLVLSKPYFEQVRKHRKKRINKKWAKRYGFRTKFKEVVFDDVMVIDRHDNEIDICGYDRKEFIR